jgi:TonB family protein
MIELLIAAGLAAAEAQGPSTLVQENAGDAFVAGVRPAAACLDRFYASPESDGIARELAARAYGEGGGADSAAELAPPLAACIALAPPGSSARSTVALYAGLPLVRRGLAERLAAQSVDVAALDRLVASRELRVLRVAQDGARAEELVAALRAARVPEAQMERAVGYVLVGRLERLFGAVVRPPAHPARHRSGAIMDTDYPSAALNRMAQGRVRIVFTITEEGRVEGCEIVASSGHAALDEPSCAIVADRYRYRPARDEGGRPVAQIGVATIIWRMTE